MHLGSADHNAIGSTFDDSKIGIGVGLRRRAETAIALDIGLCDGHGEVVGAAMVKECGDSLGPFRVTTSGIECSADATQGKESIGADLFDERDQGVASRGGGFNEPGPVGEVDS
ncbi:unannotated protein [freshwater metagenome]|uniref:Unannotated protein n=1 Tax=freshwater metagenome TaxID=449393 RepID=A0A6J6JWM8_9ZZZZ